MLFFKRYTIAVWPLLMAVLILLLTAVGDVAQHSLRLDSMALKNGQWWRLLTAHWVHLGWAHSALNVGGFLLLAWLQPKGSWKLWLIFYVVASLCISAVLLSDQRISFYMGASGVLHGLLIVASFTSKWLEPWRQYSMVLFISAKLVWEQTAWYSDESLGAIIGGHVATNSHLVGGVCGLLVVVFLLYKNRQKTN
ncbi:MAG: rhomboid family GlyGly-CTERM serine protease [Crocinitomicaceae bacterium]|jgi:rhomboid family GlyGly-CTERM serine protease